MDKVENFAADAGKEYDPRCQVLYDEPAEVIFSALLDGMDKWVRDGKVMPMAPRVVREGKGVARDSHTGNMAGGVRPPWMIVPAAAYMTDAETGCGLIYDTKIPYSAQQLRKLYGNYESYRRKFEAAKVTAIAQGYLLSEDAGRVSPVAAPADFR
jgi:hypothetical protein